MSHRIWRVIADGCASCDGPTRNAIARLQTMGKHVIVIQPGNTTFREWVEKYGTPPYAVDEEDKRVELKDI